MDRAVYRVRPGALDALSHSLALKNDHDLAKALRINVDQVAALRAGAYIGFPMAVHLASLGGTDGDLTAWTELVRDDHS